MRLIIEFEMIRFYILCCVRVVSFQTINYHHPQYKQAFYRLFNNSSFRFPYGSNPKSDLRRRQLDHFLHRLKFRQPSKLFIPDGTIWLAIWPTFSILVFDKFVMNSKCCSTYQTLQLYHCQPFPAIQSTTEVL